MGVGGITEALSGALLNSPLSEAPKNYFRNVEAVGSLGKAHTCWVRSRSAMPAVPADGRTGSVDK
jgi:hypothetical protein